MSFLRDLVQNEHNKNIQSLNTGSPIPFSTHTHNHYTTYIYTKWSVQNEKELKPLKTVTWNIKVLILMKKNLLHYQKSFVEQQEKKIEWIKTLPKSIKLYTKLFLSFCLLLPQGNTKIIYQEVGGNSHSSIRFWMTMSSSENYHQQTWPLRPYMEKRKLDVSMCQTKNLVNTFEW